MVSKLQPILQAMHQGALILTPNQHLSHVFMQHYLDAFPAYVQPKPACLPYSSFIHLCYDRLVQQSPHHDHPALLQPHQTMLLWETCQSPSSQGLAKATFTAWQLTQRWQLPLTASLFKDAPQTHLFYQWAMNFQTECHTRHVLTEEMVVPYLCQTISLMARFPYQHIIFACFDDFTPEQKNLQTFLIQQGCTIDTFDLKTPCARTQQYPALDAQHELQALKQWLTDLSCNAHAETSPPIAVIVPQLAQQGASLSRWFQFYFPHTPRYFSLGQSLADYPIITHAFTLLSLLDTCTLKEAKLLLHTPFIEGSDTEKSARAHLALNHPLLQSHFLTLETFTEALAATCPVLALTLKSLPAFPEEASPAAWANLFTERLMALGFPGPAPLASGTYQVLQRFLTLIQSFKSLTYITPLFSKEAALDQLKKITQQCLFQPQQTLEAPIHVLGLLEAAGVPYRAVWIMGLTEQQFPAYGTPTPFIPLALQRMNHLPHTDQHHEYQLNIRRLRRIQAATPTLVLSYPKQTEEGAQHPTPFLLDSPMDQLLTTTLPPEDPIPLVCYNDPSTLPIRADESVSKGTKLLAEQAKCGFRALASTRLKCEPLPRLTHGFTPEQRGILLHQTLEHFWRHVNSQQALNAMDEDTCYRTIGASVHQALRSLQVTQWLPKDLIALEQKRIKKLVWTSLQWEKTRPAFEVESVESKYNITLGSLTFQLRLDRVDTLKAGEKWVTDYKTSIPSPLPWSQDRPLEPQMLLYALIDPQIRALVFHELKKGQSTIKGCADALYPDLPLSAHEDWDVQRASWRDYLTSLTQAYVAGHCEAEPTASHLCQTCQFQALCRRPFR